MFSKLRSLCAQQRWWRTAAHKPGQRLDQAGLAVGGDEFQELTMQPPTPQVPQETIPSVLALGFDDLEVNQLTLALRW